MIEEVPALGNRVVDELLQGNAVGIEATKQIELPGGPPAPVHADGTVNVIGDDPHMFHW